MIAADIMTRDVVAVRDGGPLVEAVRLMADRHISGLPVRDAAGGFIGMLTEGDLPRRAEAGTETHPAWLTELLRPGHVAAAFVKANGREASEVMGQDVATVAEATSLADIVKLMEARDMRAVPALRGPDVVGIGARAHIVRALALAGPGPPMPSTDAATGARLHAELARCSWGPEGVTFTVTDGRVPLYGSFPDERIRRATRVVAENVPGIASVTDHLNSVDPAHMVGSVADDDARIA